jgi:hypothetical protein
VEITIGVQNVSREISIESEDTPEQVAEAVQEAITSGGILRLRDDKGRQLFVPANALGWVQLGETEKGQVGFGKI